MAAGDPYMTDFPLGPLWPGQLVNSAFYGVLMFGAMTAARALGRGRRRRKGLCPWCAYPVGNTGPCSECGAPVA